MPYIPIIIIIIIPSVARSDITAWTVPLSLTGFCLTSLPLDLWPRALALPCSRVNLGSAACCLTPTHFCHWKTLSQNHFSPQNPISTVQPTSALLPHCTTHTLPLKMAWSIWMTLLNVPAPSVRCFLLLSVPRWRTGQGHSSAWKD